MSTVSTPDDADRDPARRAGQPHRSRRARRPPPEGRHRQRRAVRRARRAPAGPSSTPARCGPRSSCPSTGAYVTEGGEMVIPYGKDQVKHAPKAGRDHVLDSRTETELERALRGAASRRSRSSAEPATTVTPWPSCDGSCSTATRRRSSAAGSRSSPPTGGRWRSTRPSTCRPSSRRRSSASTSTTPAGSREFMTRLPPAPTYFHKPITALNAHGGDVVRPDRCRWLNYEGEIAIVIGRTCRNVAPGRRRRVHRRLHDRQRLRPARLPRHRRRLDAAGQGLRHAVPDRSRRWSPTGTSTASASARSSTARSARTATPTRWSGTCTTSSPTSPARSRSCPATCCCRARRPTPGPSSRATSSPSRSRASAR